MTFLLGMIAVIVIAYHLRRQRRELVVLRVEVDKLRRRLDTERPRPGADTAPAAAPTRTDTPPIIADIAAARQKPAPAPAATAPPATTPPATAPVAIPQGVRTRAPLREAAPPVVAAGGFEPSAADWPPPRGEGGADFETRVGTTWTLRVGLGAIAVAAALFARTIVPSLSPAMKVMLAYAGAMALFAIGRVFEGRMARFGRPLMAGGLAIGFFVSFASYFVPAMQAVPLIPALLWMAAGVAAILAIANRWRSEPTAGLAIVLGHLSAYVAAGDADSYSLVVILFLSIAAVYLLWRHDWLPLSLVAVVAAYGSHLLWGLADRSGATPERAVLLSTMFLSSYYVIFLAADLLWWRRRGSQHADPGTRVAALGRILGPVNLVLYASTASFMYFAAGEAGSLTGYLFALGVLQGGLTLLYRRLGNHDWALYPALSTIFITLGFVSALDALSLDVVLAMEALVLLVAAQRTGLRVFHMLAQAVLASSFVHYVSYGALQPASLALFIGGSTIALAYFAQALLEDHWYGDRSAWRAGSPPPGIAGIIATRFDTAFRAVAPYVAHVHAAGGAVILVREAFRFLPDGDAAPLLLAAVIIIALAAVVLRSTPLMIAYGITQLGAAVATVDVAADWTWQTLAVAALLLALPTALLAETQRYRVVGRRLTTTAFVTLASIASGLIVLIEAGDAINGVGFYLAWIAVAAFAYLHAERARAAAADSSVVRAFAATISLAVAIAIVSATAELTGGSGFDVQNGVWLACWAAVTLTAAAWRRDVGFYLAGFVLMSIASAMCVVEVTASTALMSVLFIAAVPLGLAVAQDYVGAQRAVGTGDRRALVSTWTAYLLATSVLWSLFEKRIGEPWDIAAHAAVAVAIYAASFRADRSAGRSFATVLTFLVLVVELARLQAPIVGAETSTRLIATLLVATAALALERLLMTRGDAHTVVPAKYTAIALVALAAAVTMMALDRTTWTGFTYATVGFSLVGAALMVLGFIARSTHHRRIALGVFALTLARVLIVDVRAMSDAGRTVALLVLGVSLLTVAWLYSHFAARIREWL